MSVARGRIEAVDDSSPIQKIKVAYDKNTIEYLRQSTLDKLSGYVGFWLLLMGTLMWGYGDLLGKIIKHYSEAIL
jgi:hypothetical protein